MNEAVGLEWGPLNHMSTIEELLGRNSSGFSVERREYDCVDPLHCPRYTLYLQKLTLTSLTSGGRSVGIFRLWTKPRSLVFLFVVLSSVLFVRWM
jgi:hypothetical protein